MLLTILFLITVFCLNGEESHFYFETTLKNGIIAKDINYVKEICQNTQFISKEFKEILAHKDTTLLHIACYFNVQDNIKI